MPYVDLHVHLNASDGTLSSEQVIHLAHGAGLSTTALTDHDAATGVDATIGAGTKLGSEVVPGIEVLSSFKGHEIHILGLLVDTDPPSLQAVLKEFRQHRDQRNQEILKRFNVHGVHLTAEEPCTGNPDTVITRAHVARTPLTKGLGPDLDHTLKEYPKHGGTYCPSKELLPPEAAMEVSLDNHAFVVLARPFQYELEDKGTRELVACLAGLSMKGLEVYHSSYNRLESTKLQEMATCHHLLPVGGSDLHDSNKPDISIGTGRDGLRVSSLLLDVIKNTP